MRRKEATMDKVDAIVMLFSDSEQRRAAAYYHGKPAEVTSLIAVSGIRDPTFGEIILNAAFVIADEIIADDTQQHQKPGAKA